MVFWNRIIFSNDSFFYQLLSLFLFFLISNLFPVLNLVRFGVDCFTVPFHGIATKSSSKFSNNSINFFLTFASSKFTFDCCPIIPFLFNNFLSFNSILGRCVNLTFVFFNILIHSYIFKIFAPIEEMHVFLSTSYHVSTRPNDNSRFFNSPHLISAVCKQVSKCFYSAFSAFKCLLFTHIFQFRLTLSNTSLWKAFNMKSKFPRSIETGKPCSTAFLTFYSFIMFSCSSPWVSCNSYVREMVLS